MREAVSQTCPTQGLPVLAGIFLTPGAIHEGHAKWRPVGKFGYHVVVLFAQTETSRKKAMESARAGVAKIVEAGHAALGGKE